MAESLVHLRLVSRIIWYVEHEYQTVHQLAIFHDLPGLVGEEKPPRIGGFVPDLYAVDAPLSIVIVGEAKTEGDLETKHSRRQLAAFLNHLQLQPSGVFVLAVPWQVRARAKNLIARLKEELECTSIQIIVITELTG